MERAKKMVLLPVEQVERLQRVTATSHNSTVPEDDRNTKLQTTQTVGDNLSRLDDEMKRVLNSNTFVTENERLKHYIKLLQRYLFFRGEKPQKSTVSNDNYVDGSDLDDYKKIVTSVPVIYQRKTQQLLEHLKNFKDRISWDVEGTVTLDDEEIHGSNIVDLINLAARHRKTFKPIGGKEFARFLKSIKIPQEYIGNKEINTVSYSKTPESSRDKNSDSEDNEIYKTLPGEDTSFLSSTIVEKSPLNTSLEKKIDSKEAKKRWLKMNI